MDRLRAPDGCPWDQEQTYESLRRYLLEECYEVADAIDRADLDDLREELGDLLLQVVFLSRIAQEQGRFDVDQVAHGICDKLVRRHPHIFGSTQAETADEVSRNWEEIKRKERAGRPGRRSRLDGIPAALPPMARARALGDRAAQVGFDWSAPEEVLSKIAEEIAELRAALEADSSSAVREELGDLLFSVIMLARKAQVDPEAALEQTNRKFYRRFDWIERELERQGQTFEELDLQALERLWVQAKGSTGPRGEEA
jgi:MazG family protein